MSKFTSGTANNKRTIQSIYTQRKHFQSWLTIMTIWSTPIYIVTIVELPLSCNWSRNTHNRFHKKCVLSALDSLLWYSRDNRLGLEWINICPLYEFCIFAKWKIKVILMKMAKYLISTEAIFGIERYLHIFV